MCSLNEAIFFVEFWFFYLRTTKPFKGHFFFFFKYMVAICFIFIK